MIVVIGRWEKEIKICKPFFAVKIPDACQGEVAKNTFE